MTSRQEKLIENYVRAKVKKMLKESVPNQDADYLYKILKSAGPKISAAIQNLKKSLDQKSEEYQRLTKVERGWDELSFGYGELYTRLKK